MSTTDDRQKVTDAEILQRFRACEEPAMTTVELAEQLNITRQAVNIRLRQLESEGLLDRKRAGTADVWWLCR